MKQPNTKKHWTALCIAAYYQKNGHACRARDLYPMVTAIHDTGDSLISALSSLKNEGTIGYVTVETDGRGASNRVFAYYPTTITIEDLRDIGLPTELPDGSPVPDEFNIKLPVERVTAEEEKAGDIPLPTEDVPALEYVERPNTTTRTDNPRDYSTEDRFESDAKKLDFSSDGEADDGDEADGGDKADDGNESDDETPDEGGIYCEDCGAGPFDSGKALGGHKAGSGCQSTEDAEQEEDELICEQCGAGPFDSGKALGGHKSSHSRDIVDDEDTPEVAHDLGYMAARTVEPPAPKWEWHDISNRLNEKAAEASEAGLDRISTVYMNFASLAMERDLNEGTEVESEAEAILTKELVLMLLGAHHSDIDPDVIEGEDLARVTESRQAFDAME